MSSSEPTKLPAVPDPEPESPSPAGADRPPFTRWFISLSYLVVVVLAGFILFADLAPNTVGMSGVALMLLLAALRIPIGIAMALAGSLMIGAIAGFASFTTVLRSVPFITVSGWSLSVLPMFILMGLVLWRADITGRLFEALQRLLGWLPGSLAVSTNMVGAGLATLSGSTAGITYALGRIAIPEMLRAGFHPRLATGAVLAAGTGGQLIPPSILMVIYAGVAGTAVGPQLISGLVPGLALASTYALLIIGRGWLRPQSAPRATGFWKRGEIGRTAALVVFALGPVFALFVIVIGGLFAGVFTATEAGAVGAVGAILFAFLKLRTQAFRRIRLALEDTVSATGYIFLLLLGAFILNRALVLSGLPATLARSLDEFGLGGTELMLLMIPLFLLLGMFMDPIGMILVTVPILLPSVEAAGMSPLWFGVFMVLMAEIGNITPPIGILGFIVHRICQDPEVNLGHDISLGTVFRGALPFVAASIALVLAMIWIPEIVEWLPARSAG